MRSRRLALAFVPLALFLSAGGLGCGDPQPEAADAVAQAERPLSSATRWTSDTELLLDHPPLVAGEPAQLFVHLTALADFTAINDAVLTLRFAAQEGGASVEVAGGEARSPGIHAPVVTLPVPGLWDLEVELTGRAGTEVIQVDGLRVYPTASDVPEAKRHADQGITFRKQQQWQTRGFESSVAATGSLPVGIEAPGEIVPAAGRYAEVSAPIDGLVDPEGARGAPAPGEKVEEGQILAVLTPAHGESGNAVAEARAALREAEHDYARAKRLLEVEAVPKRRVEEARIRLDAARETVDAVTGGAAIAADGRITLRSPIGGVVALRDLSPGSRVEHGTQLFAIVDPSVVWLRAYIPAGEAPRIRSDATASFTLEGGGASGVTSRTVAVGSMVEPETRTVSVLYEVENPDGAIKLGAHAQVLVLTGEIAQGVVVAETAVLEEDGRPVAYVQREAERFERRELVLGPAASGSVVVLEGIAPGERVVTGAVYQVRLASVPTSAPGAGHAH